jgi:hypothetical protein
MTTESQKKSSRKRKHIPCDEVKPASARKPHIEGLDFETPVHEGPFMLKPKRNDLRRSPRKTSTESSWISGPAVLLDHTWRKKTRRENPMEYWKTKQFIAGTRGAPPLSSPSHSSLEEVKSARRTKLSLNQRNLTESFKLENDVKEMIATPYAHFDDTHWVQLRKQESLLKAKCDFISWESTRPKIALAKGATLIRGQPGPAHSYYEQKPWKEHLYFVLESTSARFKVYQLAVYGSKKGNAGFWQCNLCAKYMPSKDSMEKHLKFCVNPIKRRAYNKHVFPICPTGREWCPICRFAVKAGNTMGAHIALKHKADATELWDWGYDYELIHEQFG